MEYTKQGGFIGSKDGLWHLHINGEWQVVSASVFDCIDEAQQQGYSVHHNTIGQGEDARITINSLTKEIS